MAGARARKLDLSGYLSGNANVANLISRAGDAEAGGIAGMFSGIASGVSKFGANVREDKRLGEAKAERTAERTYQHGQDTFRNSLATKADLRAESDQRMQEEEHKIKIAADAKAGEETVALLGRAKAAQATGMPMDPKVLEEIQRLSTTLIKSGGLGAVMARAAAHKEEDPERLIGDTAKLESLVSLLTKQMGREKDPVRHAALGDAFMQLGSVVEVNKYRLRLHDANTKRGVENAEKQAVAEEEERGAYEANRAGPFDESQSPSWKKGYLGVQNAVAKDDRTLDRQKEMANVRNDLIVNRHRNEADRREGFSRELQALRDQAADERQDKTLRAQAEKALATKLDTGIAQEQRATDYWSDEYTKRKDDPKRYNPEEIHEAWVNHKAAADSLNSLQQEKRTGRRMTPPPPSGPAVAGGTETAAGMWTEAEAKEAAKAEAAQSPDKAKEIIARWLGMVGKPRQ